jgi:hypothetical protein
LSQGQASVSVGEHGSVRAWRLFDLELAATRSRHTQNDPACLKLKVSFLISLV